MVSLRTLSLSLSLVLTPLPSLVLAQVEAIFAAGAAVTAVTAQLKDDISAIISELDNVVSARSFQLRSDLGFLLSELEHTSLILADKTFGELTEQQRLFFQNAHRTIRSTEEIVRSSGEVTTSVIENVEQTLAQLPMVGRAPRVRSVEPGYIQVAGADSEKLLKIAVRGSFLNHGAVSLTFGENSCDPATTRENLLEFLCPRDLFVTDAGVGHVGGLLEIEDDKGWWERTIELFGYYEPRKQYGVSVAVVPETLGTYTLSASYVVDNILHSSRSGAWGQTNPHCHRGVYSRTFNFSPQDAGWNIDINSVQTSRSCERHGGGHAVRNASAAGFQVEAWASNSGQCVPVLGKIVAYDARGCSAGTVTWTETYTSSETKAETIKSGDLAWGRDQAIPLPQRLVGFILEVVQIDGSTVVFHEADVAKWFEVTRDATSTSLVIRPKPLGEALR